MAKPPKAFVYRRPTWTRGEVMKTLLWFGLIMFLAGVGSTLFGLDHYGYIHIVQRH